MLPRSCLVLPVLLDGVWYIARALLTYRGFLWMLPSWKSKASKQTTAIQICTCLHEGCAVLLPQLLPLTVSSVTATTTTTTTTTTATAAVTTAETITTTTTTAASTTTTMSIASTTTTTTTNTTTNNNY